MEIENNIHYGKLLQKYLKANGISYTFASKVLGIKRTTLYNRFKYSNFTFRELIKVKQFIKTKN
jgi:transcriptional regulator of acetoin/glycerol metabolism